MMYLKPKRDEYSNNAIFDSILYHLNTLGSKMYLSAI